MRLADDAALGWREFSDMVDGLLAADTRLARHLRAKYGDAETKDDKREGVADE